MNIFLCVIFKYIKKTSEKLFFCSPLIVLVQVAEVVIAVSACLGSRSSSRGFKNLIAVPTFVYILG